MSGRGGTAWALRPALTEPHGARLSPACGRDPHGQEPSPRPSIARVYNYALGGKDHFAVDREVARRIGEALPVGSNLARDCRDLVRRAVTWLTTEGGVHQIIDIGSGLPLDGNVHEIARQFRSDARVVYVDNDPTVLAHGRALLARGPTTRVIEADVRDAASIFEHPDVTSLLDLSAPVAVLVSCVLHHLDDADDPAAVLDRIKDRLPSGSYLLVANFVASDAWPYTSRVEDAFLTGLGSGRFRTLAEHQRYVEGLDLVEPGLVYANDWLPDAFSPRHSPVHRLHLAALARRP